MSCVFLTTNQVFTTQPMSFHFFGAPKMVLILNGALKVWICREGGDVVAAELQETGFSQCSVGDESMA